MTFPPHPTAHSPQSLGLGAELPHTAILSLGSNLGDREGWIAQALKALADLPGTVITRCSALYESEPVDVAPEHQDKNYINAVLVIETRLTPSEFSNSVHQIEEQLLRTRETRNQPRSIDIDIIAFDNIISADPHLTLPHPQAHLRRFVLQPLSEVDPEFIIPGQTATVAKLLAGLPEKPAVRLTE